MLEIVIIAVVILIAAVLIVAATRPGTFGVQRATTINASPEKIFPFINDFDRWRSWSPYEKKDPAMNRVFSGQATGKGAVYEWDGNRQVGKGRIEITDTSAPTRVTIKLDLIKPMEGHNIVDFTLEPRGNATQVTWAMRGSCAYPAKVMGLFCDMDKMIGKDFEVGLANLKALAEK
jgi:carbon monoxide dehydrogenase subunit G